MRIYLPAEEIHATGWNSYGDLIKREKPSHDWTLALQTTVVIELLHTCYFGIGRGSTYSRKNISMQKEAVTACRRYRSSVVRKVNRCVVLTESGRVWEYFWLLGDYQSLGSMMMMMIASAI